MALAADAAIAAAAADRAGMAYRTLRIIAFPLAVLAVFLLLYVVWVALDLPPEETILDIARSYLDRYGVVIVLICAYLEGLLVIGWYFPGTLVIILALLVAGQDVPRVAQVAALAGAGLLAAYVTNFYAGKYGWYRLLLAFGLREPLANAQRRLTRYGLSAIFTTYWQANLASVISTAAGILQFPASRFLAYSLAAEAFWIAFWATVIFFLGRAALSLAGFRMILLMILIWIAVRLIFRKKSSDAQAAG
jgi:membrane protein DedA with SNARE-associated domain